VGWKAELKKNWRARASAFFIILGLIVLMDEIVKEGYGFDPSDLFAFPPPSHEQLFLLFLALGILFGLRVGRRAQVG
jgi:hypothetical protein